MNVLLLTYGTRGDVQPYLALGQGLKARGHTVTLATSTRFEGFVAANGLKFAGMSDELLAVLDTPEGKAMMENTSNIFDAVRHNLRIAGRISSIFRTQLEDSWRAAEIAKPDLVVFHPKGFAGQVIADAFHCPAVLAMPFPMLVATGDRPHIGFPTLPFGRRYNRLTHHVVAALTDLSVKGPVSSFRSRHGLGKAAAISSLKSARGDRLVTLTLVSPSVVPEPGDWSETDHMSGYCFPEPDKDYQPPRALSDFLQSGPPPVYIGFGSISGRNPARLADIAVRALKSAGQRGILATGWGGLSPGDVPDDVLVLDQAPHDWLFPKLAAIVHHGGAGTTAAALRAGVPTLVTPFFGDQPFWGARVAALGVGPAPIPQKQLSPEALADAIRTMTSDQSMIDRSQALGEIIRGEAGVARAVSVLEAVFQTSDTRRG